MGGAGDDRFVINLSNTHALESPLGINGNTDQLASINGGTGIDTVQLSEGASLDLTLVSNVGAGSINGFSRIESIEVIDMGTDAATNVLTLTHQDVWDMSGMNLFNNANGWNDGTYDLAAGGVAGANPEQRHQLVVKGGANDSLDIDLMAWTNAGDVTNGSVSYDVYNQGLYAQLLVQQGLMVL
jgi:hypothetical protein